MKSTIKQLREERNMSREELAYKAGVSLVTVYNWEDLSDLKKLSYERLEAISNALNTPIQKILSK